MAADLVDGLPHDHILATNVGLWWAVARGSAEVPAQMFSNPGVACLATYAPWWSMKG